MSGDAVAAALAVLADVKARCRTQDMRTPAVLAALEYLEARASVTWPFVQFRRSLTWRAEEIPADAEGRWQSVNASLNAVRRAVGRLRGAPSSCSWRCSSASGSRACSCGRCEIV